MQLSHIVNRAVQKLGLPAWCSGYRYWPYYTPAPGDEAYRELARASVMKYPLPVNVTNAEDLPSKAAENCPHSFREVPNLLVPATYAVTLRDCLVLRHTSEWGDDFYAIVTQDGRSLSLPGIGFRPEHRIAYRARGDARTNDRGTWFLGMWTRNFYLWHTVYMPKVILAQKMGISGELVLPPRKRWTPFQAWTLNAAGVQGGLLLGHEEKAWRFRELTVLQTSPYAPGTWFSFRQAIGNSSVRATRKVYISRKRAHYRKLTNENEIQRLFLSRGWEVHCMEDHAFEEQVCLLGETQCLAGLHGAGFAGMIYMPPGGSVLEIGVRQRPNANFYALACALEHRYAVVLAETAGLRMPVLYDDARADVARVESTLNAMSSQYEQQ